MTQIIVTPNPVPEGCRVRITVTGGTPHSTLTVDIQNGQGGQTAQVTVQLDEQGNGSTTWTVPTGWAANGTASFDAPGATGDSIIINPNTGEPCPDV